LRPFVNFSFFDLGCHVSESSSVALKAVDRLVRGKSEVSDFEIEVVVDENVFEL